MLLGVYFHSLFEDLATKMRCLRADGHPRPTPLTECFFAVGCWLFLCRKYGNAALLSKSNPRRSCLNPAVTPFMFRFLISSMSLENVSGADL